MHDPREGLEIGRALKSPRNFDIQNSENPSTKHRIISEFV